MEDPQYRRAIKAEYLDVLEYFAVITLEIMLKSYLKDVNKNNIYVVESLVGDHSSGKI